MLRPVHPRGDSGGRGRVALSTLQPEAGGGEEAQPVDASGRAGDTPEEVQAAVEAAIDVQADDAGRLSALRFRHVVPPHQAQRSGATRDPQDGQWLEVSTVEEEQPAGVEYTQVLPGGQRLRPLRHMQPPWARLTGENLFDLVV